MAAIYSADVFCDGCAEEIKVSVCDDLWGHPGRHECPDGTDVAEFDSREELDDHLRGMDDRTYDSDSYPKYCGDDEESDCPQHCGSHADCVNAEVCADGTKIGYFFGNDLTTDGADYVRSAVREDVESGCTDSVAIEVWFPCYDWIEWGDVGHCDDCGALAILSDCAGDDVCDDCNDSDALRSTDSDYADEAEGAFHNSHDSTEGDAHHEARVCYEHGQLWIVCPCGASWSVVDCEDDGERYFGFERVSDGDEDYHCSDTGPGSWRAIAGGR